MFDIYEMTVTCIAQVSCRFLVSEILCESWLGVDIFIQYERGVLRTNGK